MIIIGIAAYHGMFKPITSLSTVVLLGAIGAGVIVASVVSLTTWLVAKMFN